MQKIKATYGTTPVASHAAIYGRRSIQILEYLSVIVTRCDMLGVFEIDAYSILPFALKGSECHTLTKNSVNGIHNCPTAVQFLLRAFAKNNYKAETVQSLSNFRLLPGELKRQYSDRIDDAHTPAGEFLPEDQKFIQFVNGLDGAVQN